MEKKVIIINGTGGSGKDTFVNQVQSFAPEPIANLSTVDQIKQVAVMLGWNGDKEEKSRKFLSDLKDLWTEYSDGPFNDILSRIEKTKANICFVHCREPEEIKRFANHYGNNCITLLIKRKDHKTKGNHADEGVEHYKYDIVINNDSDINNLQKKAINFYSSIIN